ncbi:hypothetical protein B0H19DRAFT_1069711 [Mycena capillaripes]|nr:hypothetical protein B0H19DRAFT_1069711 [Mycena capillaripes]
MPYKGSKFLARAIKRLESLVSLQQAASDVPGQYTLAARGITWNHSRDSPKIRAGVGSTIPRINRMGREMKLLQSFKDDGDDLMRDFGNLIDGGAADAQQGLV